MIHLLGLCTALLYAGAALLQLRQLRAKPAPGLDAFLIRWLRLGVLLHAGLLAMLAFTARESFAREPASHLLWISWLIMCAYVVSPARLRSPLTGAALSTVAALCFVNSSILLHLGGGGADRRLSTAFLVMHVVPVLCAEVSLALAGAASAAYLVQDAWLRRSPPQTPQQRAPALAVLVRLNRYAAIFGFATMTLAILSGAIWAAGRGYRVIGGDPIQGSALVAWAALGWILHCRQQLLWSERRLARLTLWLTVTVFGVIFIVFFLQQQGIHAPFHS